eukprot:TRINITY_DN5021_c0_g1_i1.p1 TRINITY_DN5021_c0_g1~~TRINITY_DN5021_c0_g1_i1.p1  ORF type:complete len:368 (-),score=81.87 TRINITY_DN5021_c0_g1_i1:579-1682(-)
MASPLFFVLAATSSEAPSSEGHGGHLALHPCSKGWTSARGCDYPQEVLLQLEKGAEIHEVEITSKGECIPSSVDVFLSRSSWEDCLQGDPSFEHVGSLHFSEVPRSSGNGGSRKARLKLFALSSGQVRLVVHDPLEKKGPRNPFRQVSLSSVELWGVEDALPSAPAKSSHSKKPQKVLDDAGGGDEVSQVLMELGVPLSLVPFDEDSERLVGVDAGTRRLLKELADKNGMLLESCRFGESQQLVEHMQQLSLWGKELQQLISKRDRLVSVRSIKEAERLGPEIQDLEEKRLHLAAFYDTNFWLEMMNSSFGFAQLEPVSARTIWKSPVENAPALKRQEPALQQLPEEVSTGRGSSDMPHIVVDRPST